MDFFSDEYLLHHGLQDDYLMHYGVPGMKWGVRKARGAAYRYSAALNGAAAKISRAQGKIGPQWYRRNKKLHASMYESASKYARNKANQIDPKKTKQPKSDAERRAARKKLLKRAAIAAGVGAAAVGTTMAIKKGYGRYANRIPAYDLATLSPSSRARGNFRRSATSAARSAAGNARRMAGNARSTAGNAARNARYRANNAYSTARNAASGARRQGVIARGRARNAAYRAQSGVRSAAAKVRRTPSASRALAIQAPSTRARGSYRRRAASAARGAYSSARSGARRAASSARSAAAGARFRASQEAKFVKNYRRVRGGYVRR